LHDEEQVRDDAVAWLRTHGPASAGELVGCLDLEDTWSDRELYELLLDDRVDDPLGCSRWSTVGCVISWRSSRG
jgi:hypothetical protein